MARKPGKSPQSIRDRAAKTAAVKATPAGSAPAEVRALSDALAKGPLDDAQQDWVERLSHAHLTTP